ncbi:PP2C family protein-serine/threonine phosphatase [Nocardioides zeae]|uniref:Serine phosphatase RsbU (Regulator of sigma subunit) n=1 Tax=Nocardioides zeae TaxID=1457234 RepID=A0AAJ1TZM2_9ACTN|nr:PP2C family protein-serine/threonine phosphatase [Nocardioides zeae]MDQ1105265.1 serine phosphatase RsbU (regulator of sigma subunit) [Nocardioides zeae]
MTLWEGAGPDLHARYDAVDWASTPLGPPEQWTGTLRGALRTIVNSRFPAVLLWGEEFVLLYNEAYVELIADKHPDALGRTAQSVFPEAWDEIGPLMQGVLDGGGSFRVDRTLMPLHRRGFLEDCWFTYSYSPVQGTGGRIEGVLDIAVEITSMVLAQRRAITLTGLADVLAGATTAQDLRSRSLALLRGLTEEFAAIDLRLPGEPVDAGADGADLPPAPSALLVPTAAYVEETAAGRVVWLQLGQPAPGEEVPVLVARQSGRLPFDYHYRHFLRGIANALTQALTRIELLASERRQAEAERNVSIALQRALLTPPPEHERLAVAVRYVPAAHVAQIGGDWYDAFLQHDGALVLAIGDVAGHDLAAAGTMAQARNLTRGIAVATVDGPARVLEGLDRALELLEVRSIATAIVARVEPLELLEQLDPDAQRDRWRFVWSRAGHPPAVLLRPDGTTQVLDAGGETILGIDPATVRTDLAVHLPVGSTVVLYTDGLIERRGIPLDVSIKELCTALAAGAHLDAEALSDHLLSTLVVPSEEEDDVALVVLRVVS